MEPKEQLKYRKLTPLETREEAAKLKGWTLVEGRLEKEYTFLNFARALVFVNKIVNPVEEHQNYPRITITYNRVKVSLLNHVSGVLAPVDFEVAAEMDSL